MLSEKNCSKTACLTLGDLWSLNRRPEVNMTTTLVAIGISFAFRSFFNYTIIPETIAVLRSDGELPFRENRKKCGHLDLWRPVLT